MHSLRHKGTLLGLQQDHKQVPAGWKLIGFPGAYANYYHYIDQHGLRFDRAPISLADNGRGVVHVHPDIPAIGGALQARPPQPGGR